MAAGLRGEASSGDVAWRANGDAGRANCNAPSDTNRAGCDLGGSADDPGRAAYHRESPAPMNYRILVAVVDGCGWLALAVRAVGCGVGGRFWWLLAALTSRSAFAVGTRTISITARLRSRGSSCRSIAPRYARVSARLLLRCATIETGVSASTPATAVASWFVARRSLSAAASPAAVTSLRVGTEGEAHERHKRREG